MTALPVRAGVHGELVRRLGLGILEGTWPPGGRLPNETELCDRYRISRTALREAVRFLAAKELIEARPRLGMVVRGRESWNLLDPELLAWQREWGTFDADLVRSLLEARRVIEPAAAAIAAERATASDLARIEAGLLGMIRNLPGDLDACCNADLAFHREILGASHNVVFRQLAGTIDAALEATFRISTELSRSYERTIEAHREVLEAIRLRNPTTAEARMRALIDVAQADLQPAVRDLAQGSVRFGLPIAGQAESGAA
jgi:GntR family transcriptional regulator, galactonate operon transcriptional repressor